MATTTGRLGLVKPATGDLVDVNQLNSNFDKLDTNPGIFVGATAPSNPWEGQVYFDTAADRLRVWNGSKWVPHSFETGQLQLVNNWASWGGTLTVHRFNNIVFWPGTYAWRTSAWTATASSFFQVTQAIPAGFRPIRSSPLSLSMRISNNTVGGYARVNPDNYQVEVFPDSGGTFDTNHTASHVVIGSGFWETGD